MLSSWGIPFEAINVEGNPAALKELEHLGLRLVPVLTDGERVLHGWNPPQLASFVGVEKPKEPGMEMAQLARLLDHLLSAAQRAILEVPPDRLDVRVPNRDRTIRDLVFHLFRLSLAYRDAFEARYFPEDWLMETPPPEVTEAVSLASYGESVRTRLAEWFARTSRNTNQESIDTYYGLQTPSELLERTVWHAAHHLLQVYALMEDMHVTPRNALTRADFTGLPIPANLW